MGKGGGSLPKSPTDKEQAKILKELEATIGKPTRALVVPKMLQTLGGEGVFQTTLPSTDRDVIEQQFRRAQTGILNTSPVRGGQLNSQLGQLQRDRAFDVSSAVNQAKQRGIERSLGLISAAIPNAQSQQQAAAGIAGREQQRNMANAQQQSQKGAGMGGLVGTGLKALMK
jgi:hypothetical protein